MKRKFEDCILKCEDPNVNYGQLDSLKLTAGYDYHCQMFDVIWHYALQFCLPVVPNDKVVFDIFFLSQALWVKAMERRVIQRLVLRDLPAAAAFT